MAALAKFVKTHCHMEYSRLEKDILLDNFQAMIDANKEEYDQSLDSGIATVEHILNIFEDALEYYTTE